MNRTATVRILAGTSILGLSVAIAATVLGHIGLGPGFNPLVLTVSDYALSDRGAAIEAAMVALGGASLALLVGLAAARAPVRGIPTVLLVAWAAGLLLAAAVPTDPIGTPVLSTAGYVHRYASVAAFLCLPAAALILASRFATEPAWRALSFALRRLAEASGAGLALLFYVAFPGDRILMGLVERALIAVEVVVLLLLALRLLWLHPAAPGVRVGPLRRRRRAVSTSQPPGSRRSPGARGVARGWPAEEGLLVSFVPIRPADRPASLPPGNHAGVIQRCSGRTSATPAETIGNSHNTGFRYVR